MPKVYHELAVQAGLHEGVDDEKLLKYSQSIVKLCVQVCLKGDKTQTTCFGATEAIREHFRQ